MKKTWLLILLIISFILASSVSAIGEEDFFELVKTGTPEEVKKAIKEGADVNARTTEEIESFGEVEGVTPLIMAAWYNENPEVTKLLLDAGADVNARDKNGCTPLIWAAVFNENPEVTKVLIDAGANVNARSEYGTTPLMHAAWYNQNPEVIKVLLDAGADGRVKDNAGKTAFDYAEGNEHIKGTEVYWLLNDAQY